MTEPPSRWIFPYFYGIIKLNTVYGNGIELNGKLLRAEPGVEKIGIAECS